MEKDLRTIENDEIIRATKQAIRETQALLDQLSLTEYQTRRSLEKMRVDLKQLEGEYHHGGKQQCQK